MPLQRKIINLPFDAGINEKIDHKHLPAGQLDTCRNVRFDKIGTITKRPGFDKEDIAIQTGGETRIVNKTASLFTRDSELYGVLEGFNDAPAPDAPEEPDGYHVFSRDDASSKWWKAGRCEPMRYGVRSISQATVETKSADYAENTTLGIGCAAWVEYDHASTKTRIAIALIDTATGSFIRHTRGESALDDAVAPHVVKVGAYFHVYAISPTTAEIDLIVINTAAIPAAPAMRTTTVTITNVHAGGLYDCCYFPVNGTTDHSCCLYKESVAGKLTLKYYEGDGTLTGTVDLNAVCGTLTPKSAVTIANTYDHNAVADLLTVAYIDNGTGNTKICILADDLSQHTADATLTTDTAADTIHNITLCVDPSWDRNTVGNSAVRVYMSATHGTDACYNYVRQAIFMFAGIAGRAFDGTTFKNCALASKAFPYNHSDTGGLSHYRAGVWVVYDSDLQSTLFLVGNTAPATDYTAPALDQAEQFTAARLLCSVASGTPADQHLPSVVPSPTGGDPGWRFATTRRERFDADGDVILSAVICSMTKRLRNMDSAQMGPTAQVAIGQLFDVDGRAYESGYHYYPEPLQETDAGGGALADADYTYRAIYEWTDRSGQVHRSAYGEVTCTVAGKAGAGSCVIGGPYLERGDTSKIQEVRIALYRLCSDGSYHRVVEVTGGKINDLTNPQWTITDGVADGTLLDNEILYTDGSALENIAPPPCTIIADRRDRLFVVDDEDRTKIWPSKTKVHGEGLAFSDITQFWVKTGGDIVALAVMDERVIVFKEHQIHVFAGPGPNDYGVGSFTAPRPVSTSIGCKDRNSIAQTDKGIVFWSHDGWYMLNRGLGLEYIGAPIEDHKANIPSSAVAVPWEHELRITYGSTILVWDYLLNRWSVSSLPSTVIAYSSCLWDEKHCVLDSLGNLWTQDKTASGFRDDTTEIETKAITSWIKPGDLLAGYQRIWWVHLTGQVLAAHTLNVDVFYDYEDTVPGETFDFVITAAADPMELRFKPARQRCKAIRFSIYDSARSTPFSSFDLSEIALEVGYKPGLAKMRATNTL